MVRVLVIGHGHLGRYHAQKVDQLEMSELVAIVEPAQETWQEIKSLYPKAQLFSALEEVNIDYDAALVCTPTSLHFQLVDQLIDLGKHIFCEKPFLHRYDDCRHIFKKLKNRPELKIQVGHSERYHACWGQDFYQEHLASLFNQASIWELARYGDFKPRARDVDVASDLLIHDIDLALYLTGELPTYLKAQGHKVASPHYDVVHIQLEFPSGKHVYLHANRFSPRPRRELFVSGEQGSAFVDLMNNRVQRHSPTGIEEAIDYPKRDHLLLEQKDFYTSIKEDRPTAVDFEQGVRPIYLIDMAYQSIQEKRGVELDGAELSHPGR